MLSTCCVFFFFNRLLVTKHCHHWENPEDWPWFSIQHLAGISQEKYWDIKFEFTYNWNIDLNKYIVVDVFVQIGTSSFGDTNLIGFFSSFQRFIELIFTHQILSIAILKAIPSNRISKKVKIVYIIQYLFVSCSGNCLSY